MMEIDNFLFYTMKYIILDISSEKKTKQLLKLKFARCRR
jgi:hypothetical protein